MGCRDGRVLPSLHRAAGSQPWIPSLVPHPWFLSTSSSLPHPRRAPAQRSDRDPSVSRFSANAPGPRRPTPTPTTTTTSFTLSTSKYATPHNRSPLASSDPPVPHLKLQSTLGLLTPRQSLSDIHHRTLAESIPSMSDFHPDESLIGGNIAASWTSEAAFNFVPSPFFDGSSHCGGAVPPFPSSLFQAYSSLDPAPVTPDSTSFLELTVGSPRTSSTSLPSSTPRLPDFDPLPEPESFIEPFWGSSGHSEATTSYTRGPERRVVFLKDLPSIDLRPASGVKVFSSSSKGAEFVRRSELHSIVPRLRIKEQGR